MGNYTTNNSQLKTGRISDEEKRIIIQMRNDNKSYLEIAKALNCSKSRVNSWCRANGYGGFKANQDKNPDNAEQTLQRRLKKYYNGRFIYMGGYKHSDDKIELMCASCGTNKSINAQQVRKKRTIHCKGCKELRKELKENAINLQRNLDARYNNIIETVNKEYNKTINICSECGDVFQDDTAKLTCSVKCSKRRHNRIKHERKRNLNVIDKDITLNKLIKRDRNVCHICGTQCDKNDYERTKEGHFIVGNMYPSIDHLKPVSRGGSHSWDNIKLAHHYCNTIKSNKNIYIKGQGQLEFTY